MSMSPLRRPGFADDAMKACGKHQFNWLTRCPTLLGLLRSFCLWYPSQPQVRLVDQVGVSSNKTESPTVSANDVLTSHLLMLSGFGFGYMSINLRDRGLGVTSLNAGNYVHRVHLRPDDFSEPAQVRKALSRYFTGGCDQVPDCWSSMVTRHGLVSNWAGLHHEVMLPSSTPTVHLPVIAHPQPGFGFFIIFRPRKNALAVYYSLRSRAAMDELLRSPLLTSSVIPRTLPGSETETGSTHRE